MGEYTLPDDYKAEVQVIVNPEEKTLKFIDTGLVKVFTGIRDVCIGIDGQAHAGDPSVPVARPGLLARETNDCGIAAWSFNSGVW